MAALPFHFWANCPFVPRSSTSSGLQSRPASPTLPASPLQPRLVTRRCFPSGSPSPDAVPDGSQHKREMGALIQKAGKLRIKAQSILPLLLCPPLGSPSHPTLQSCHAQPRSGASPPLPVGCCPCGMERSWTVRATCTMCPHSAPICPEVSGARPLCLCSPLPRPGSPGEGGQWRTADGGLMSPLVAAG